MSYRRLFSGVSVAALAPDLATHALVRINTKHAAVLITNDVCWRCARGNSRLAVVYAGHLIRAGRVARGQGDRACDQYQQSHGVSFCGHPVILDTRNFVQPCLVRPPGFEPGMPVCDTGAFNLLAKGA